MGKFSLDGLQQPCVPDKQHDAELVEKIGQVVSLHEARITGHSLKGVLFAHNIGSTSGDGQLCPRQPAYSGKVVSLMRMGLLKRQPNESLFS